MGRAIKLKLIPNSEAYGTFKFKKLKFLGQPNKKFRPLVIFKNSKPFPISKNHDRNNVLKQKSMWKYRLQKLTDRNDAHETSKLLRTGLYSI